MKIGRCVHLIPKPDLCSSATSSSGESWICQLELRGPRRVWWGNGNAARLATKCSSPTALVQKIVTSTNYIFHVFPKSSQLLIHGQLLVPLPKLSY